MDFNKEETAILTLWTAYRQLLDLGWQPITTCPKDGTTFEAIVPNAHQPVTCHAGTSEFGVAFNVAGIPADSVDATPILWRPLTKKARV